MSRGMSYSTGHSIQNPRAVQDSFNFRSSNLHHFGEIRQAQHSLDYKKYKQVTIDNSWLIFNIYLTYTNIECLKHSFRTAHLGQGMYNHMAK